MSDEDLHSADLESFLDGLLEHVHATVGVYRDVVRNPPDGMAPAHALLAAAEVPSHRLIDGQLQTAERSRLLMSAHRNSGAGGGTVPAYERASGAIGSDDGADLDTFVAQRPWAVTGRDQGQSVPLAVPRPLRDAGGNPSYLSQRRSELVRSIVNEYGISIDSTAGAAAVWADFPDAPMYEKKKIQALPLEDLNSMEQLHEALANFAPIIGPKRANSNRAGISQEVVVAALVTSGMFRKSAVPWLAGQYFKERSLINLYAGALNANRYGPKTISWVATHELAHGLLGYALDDYSSRFWGNVEAPWVPASGDAYPTPEDDFRESMAAFLAQSMKFVRVAPRHAAAILLLSKSFPATFAVRTGETPVGAARRLVSEMPGLLPWFISKVGTWTPDGRRFFPGERPISLYGETNADEDFAEAAMYYFNDNAHLRQYAPQRAAYFDDLVKSWTKSGLKLTRQAVQGFENSASSLPRVSATNPTPHDLTGAAAPNAADRVREAAPMHVFLEAPRGGRTETPHSPSFIEEVTTEAQASIPPGVEFTGVVAERRALATPANLDTERFDPDIFRPQAEGLLAGAKISARSDVRRFQMEDGLWITEFTGRIHLNPQDGVTANDIRSLTSRLTRAAHQGFNAPEFRLPNGDRLRVVIEFVDSSPAAHHVVQVHAGPGATTTTDWYLGVSHGVPLMIAQALHEFAHMVLGLRDRYQDPGSVFRRSPKSAAVRASGTVMAGDPGADLLLSDEDLSDIETLIQGGPVIRDLPHPLAPSLAGVVPARIQATLTFDKRQGRQPDAPLHTARESTKRSLIAQGGEGQHRSPAAPAARTAASEEDYALQIHRLLAADPVDVLTLLLVLERRASAPSLYTPTSLEITFKRLFRMNPGEAISEALLAKRLPRHAIRDILGAMGFMDDKLIDRDRPLRHIVPPRGRPVSEAREVIQYARDVRHALVQRDAKLVMNLLRALDRDTFKLRAVSAAYRTRYHTDMLRDLTEGLQNVGGEDYTARITHAIGAVNDGPVSLEQAQAWLMQLMQTTFDHSRYGTTPVTPAHPEDGCYLRAHFYANQLVRWGVLPRKVFIAGRDLGVLATTARGATNYEPREVKWRYHVAPVVLVGKAREPMVLDPALSAVPLLVKSWAMKIAASGASWDNFVRVEGSLPDVHLRFVSDQRRNPSAWVEGWPKQTTLALTDGHAIFFPGPGAWFPNSWGEADTYVQSKQDLLHEFYVEAERRTLARAISDALVGVRDKQYSRKALLVDLQSIVRRHSSAPGLLDEYADLGRSLRVYLGPYYPELSALFSSTGTAAALAEGIAALRVSDRHPVERRANSSSVKAPAHRAPRAWEAARTDVAGTSEDGDQSAAPDFQVFLDTPRADISGSSGGRQTRPPVSENARGRVDEATAEAIVRAGVTIGPFKRVFSAIEVGEIDFPVPASASEVEETPRVRSEGPDLQTRKYSMTRLLGHDALRITKQLAEVKSASRSSTEAEREQRHRRLKSTFHRIAEEAGRHIDHDLALSSTPARILGRNNTRFVITDIRDAPHVALVLAQGIADVLGHRVYVEHAAGVLIPVCPN
ncbi:protein-glutamine glutaminase family protein [Streptomyces sp. NPDC090080]|uniref:protein-glutamine glutaminase family protein n=1 Tax=Streptomyces sp. NPDC090080 TaxID=3365939 RepID=UPI003819C436